jgi:hypothetical protein
LNPKAQGKQQQKKPTWKVHAYFLDACNCDWGCPCQFNAKPTHGNCEGVAGYHIVMGRYGTNIKLDGLNMALIASWPGPLHEGHGRASYYIDNRADEKQFGKGTNNGKKGAQYDYPNSFVQLLGYMRVYFHLPYRQTEGVVRAHAGKRLPAIPDYSTISRRLNELNIKIKEKVGNDIVIASVSERRIERGRC